MTTLKTLLNVSNEPTYNTRAKKYLKIAKNINTIEPN